MLFILSSLVTGLFFLVLLLNQQWFPPLRLQASHCSTLRIMCDVSSIAVYCSESTECFPGIASNKFFLKHLVTIPVPPIITGTIVHFRFHIHCISVPKHLYFNFFTVPFCTAFLSAGIATSISVHVFSFLFLIIISNLYYYYYYYLSRFITEEVRNHHWLWPWLWTNRTSPHVASSWHTVQIQEESTPYWRALAVLFPSCICCL